MNEEIKEKIKAYYLGEDIGEVLDFITNLQVQLQQKENIIKELDKQNKELGAELSLTIDKYEKKLFVKENIIKEIRKYIEEHTTYERYGYIDEIQLVDLNFNIKDLKQILDKENNSE